MQGRVAALTLGLAELLVGRVDLLVDAFLVEDKVGLIHCGRRLFFEFDDHFVLALTDVQVGCQVVFNHSFDRGGVNGIMQTFEGVDDVGECDV